MTLVRCRDCQTEISDAAKTCPKCGRPNKPPKAPAFTKPPEKRFRVVLAAGVGAVLLAVAMGHDDRGNAAPVDSDVFAASAACNEVVLTHLKAPTSAAFAERYGENVTQRLSDGRYQMQSSVDAQNSFGATLRADFTCIVERRGDGWALDSLSVTMR